MTRRIKILRYAKHVRHVAFQFATRVPTKINFALNHSYNGKQADFVDQVGSARDGSGIAQYLFMHAGKNDAARIH